MTAPTWAEAREAARQAYLDVCTLEWNTGATPPERRRFDRLDAARNEYAAALKVERLALVRATIARLAKEARDEDRYPGRFPFLTAQEMEQYDPAAVLAALEQEGGGNG